MKIFIERVTNNLVDVTPRDYINKEIINGDVTIDYLVIIGKEAMRGTFNTNVKEGFFKEIIDVVSNRLA